MHLLATLGFSYAVVPEAYLMGNGEAGYDEVLVLATSGIDKSVSDCREWFAEHAPDTALRVFVISKLPDIRNADDHARYEEALFRAFADLLRRGGLEQLHVCLAGGFKTISSAAHQSADLFGCAKLFHITSPFRERFDTHDAILEGIDSGKLSLVDLGPRPGWPTVVSLLDEAPPLPSPEQDFVVDDTSFRARVLNRVSEANRLAQSEHELSSLPFPKIARWLPSARHWLQQPLDPEADVDWVASLPKVELHCHLGGFATHGAELQAVRAAAERPGDLPHLEEPKLPDGWPLPSKPVGLEDYRRLGDANGSQLLRDPGCLRRQCELLYHHLCEQRIAYAEIRCSPGNYTGSGRSPWSVLCDIRETFQRCMEEAAARQAGAAAPGPPDAPPCHVNLILIGTRQAVGDYRAAISRHISLAIAAAEHWTDDDTCRVVGVDLAGYEDITTRAHYFREEFTAIHRCGLALTVHAGENDDAEGIWRAVFDLNARRLGHALHLIDSPELLRSVADRGVAVEMCPYANFQIRGFPLDVAEGRLYPLKHYLGEGVRVTVNTDNIGISAASLTDNLLLAARLCPNLTRMDILRLLRNACDVAFVSARVRSRLITRVESLLRPP